MNYYPHHIGDFNNATRHLTRVERSVYRDMLDLYYDTEKPLSLDMVALCRKLLARSDEESTAVEQVLNEFFTQTEHGWHHSRCEDVIQDYYTNISAKSAAGKASAAKREAERLAKLNGCSTVAQQPLDSVDSSVELTKTKTKTNNQNQEPVKTKEAKPAASPDLFGGIDPQVVSDFKAMRSKQKAVITKTVIDGIQREASIAGLSLEDALRISCERGWRGFKAEWISQQPRASPARAEKFDPTAYVNRPRSQQHERTIDLNEFGEPV